MPGTRSRTSAAARAHSADEQQACLAFNEPLTWRAAKPIPVAELLRRLQSLSEELRSFEQDEVARDSLLPVAKELASPNMLSHKDRGVRAWAGCCIVEMFRLCAPDAPYTASQLKDVFALFINTVFRALSDPSNPYNSQHLFILKSLAEVKSVVLLLDIPSSGDLIPRMFAICFDVLSGPSRAESGEELSKNVEHHMTAILATLVDESDSLPHEVIDDILAQFLRADPEALASNGVKGKRSARMVDGQSTLSLKEAPPAYNMAKNICNACTNKLTKEIGLYFSSVFGDAPAARVPSLPRSGKHRSSAGDGDLDDDRHHQVSEEYLRESRKAHRLLRELWRAAPAVLQDIVPQLELELGTEDVQLRLFATETLGDMVAGIGAAGAPPPPPYNPSAYPPLHSLSSAWERGDTYNFFTTPQSPHSFPSKYHQVYESFLSRRNDKSPLIRSAWVASIGRILATSAGGVGLDVDDERQLLAFFGDMLVDGDERVRLAAIRAVDRFHFDDIVSKLGSRGSVSESGSILGNLADRVRDRKATVRSEATNALGRIWGAAAGWIVDGSECTAQLLGPIPSRILDARYVDDPDVNAMIDRVLFEQLLPIGFPAIKTKGRDVDGRTNAKADRTEAETDKIRVERMLILIRDLVDRSKAVLFARQKDQAVLAKYMDAFLKSCEEYNGGVIDKDEEDIKHRLGRFIDYHVKTLPESSRASEDLWKFAKMHDRRAYKLIGDCIDANSDYRKVRKAIREVFKRIDDATGSTATMHDTLLTLMYRTSFLLYNRSHVPAIIEFSHTNAKGLARTAHEVLKEISSHCPDVLRDCVHGMCTALEGEAPTEHKPNEADVVDDLKACAVFARHLPKDLPTERRFVQSMVAFAVHGTPPKAAKYGVQIALASTDKKEMLAHDLLRMSIAGFEYGQGNYLARLAAMSQMMLLGGKAVEECIDSVVEICINQVLLTTTAPADPDNDPPWMHEPSEDCSAKMWALKVLVNRLRGVAGSECVQTSAPVFRLLNTLVETDGALSHKLASPAAQKSRLRLLGAQLILKLCRERRFDAQLSGEAFNRLALVCQDHNLNVRQGFVTKLMKYLGQDRLPNRFYAPVFLLAFEPDQQLKNRAATWLRARQSMLARAKARVLEKGLARLLSLLAHHPHYEADALKLRDFAQYVIFYLQTVANADNIALIYHVAQRVKSVTDTLKPERSEHLYALSDLAQGVIQCYHPHLGPGGLQAPSEQVRLPADVFEVLKDRDMAPEIVGRQYLPDELVDELEDLVKNSLRKRKRKLDSSGETRERKRSRAPVASTGKHPSVHKPSKRALKKTQTAKDTPFRERRRSGRVVNGPSYAELSSDEGAESEEGEYEDEADGGDEEQDDGVEDERSDASPNHQDEDGALDGTMSTAASSSPPPAERRRNGRRATRRTTRS